MTIVSTKVEDSTFEEIQKRGMTPYEFAQTAIHEKLLRIDMKDETIGALERMIKEQNIAFHQQMLAVVKSSINTRTEILSEFEFLKIEVVSELEKNAEKETIVKDKINNVLVKIFDRLGRLEEKLNGK